MTSVIYSPCSGKGCDMKIENKTFPSSSLNVWLNNSGEIEREKEKKSYPVGLIHSFRSTNFVLSTIDASAITSKFSSIVFFSI